MGTTKQGIIQLNKRQPYLLLFFIVLQRAAMYNAIDLFVYFLFECEATVPCTICFPCHNPRNERLCTCVWWWKERMEKVENVGIYKEEEETEEEGGRKEHERDNMVSRWIGKLNGLCTK